MKLTHALRTALGFLLVPIFAWLAVSIPAAAQTGNGVRIGAGALIKDPVNRFRNVGTPQTAESRRRAGTRILQLVPAGTVPWAAILAMNNAADAQAMKGWTPLTNGASRGGAAVFRAGGITRVVVRAADDFLYLTKIDPSNPGGPLNSSAWIKTSVEVASEPDCQSTSFQESSEALCAFLGKGGSAQISWIGGTYATDPEDLGGRNAGARPTVGTNPFSNVCNCDKDNNSVNTGLGTSIPTGRFDGYTLYVWDGGTGLFRLGAFTFTDIRVGRGTPVELVPELAGWKKMKSEFQSPLGCTDLGDAPHGEFCAVATGNSVSTFQAEALSPDKIMGMVVGKPVPGGLGAKTAPVLLKTAAGATVIVVRNAAGRLYRSVNRGAWKDEGGAARAGSQVSCIFNQEQPTCFIQGPDGRIWWKQLGTAGGL